MGGGRGHHIGPTGTGKKNSVNGATKQEQTSNVGPLLGALLIHCPKEVRRLLACLGLAAVLEDNPPALKLRRCGGGGQQERKNKWQGGYG